MTSSIEYVGEHIWAGKLGYGFVVLSFVAALLSFVCFCFSTKRSEYLSFARIIFKLHALAVVGIAVTLFFMLLNHFFEYQYIWQHSNKSMDMKFILSCFWEGQEGSFLLWTFWNVVLGLILNRVLKNTEWEAPTMAVFALVQIFLASMILGIYIGDYKIGTNPFLLLREHEQYRNMPFIQNPNYLLKLDGRGLNPLLMNYWMTIHPPTLFLGFASTLVPFAFAIAAFWNKKFNEWQKLALPWAYFSVCVLGIGILMGGAWAYEALSFGGFWAWDPVENSSLVPWLVIVAAAHTMIINKNKGGSLFTTHFLSIAAFLLVLYSTFLTRSGILGNSSVHAFTDLGMTGQLVMYVLTFVFISVALLIHDELIKYSYIIGSLLIWFFSLFYGHQKLALEIWCVISAGMTFWAYIKYFPKEKDEEALYSREFWMFVGSLILLLIAMVITYFTSLPVINKLFDLKYAQLKVQEYNDFILPFAVVLVILIACGQFLKYKKNNASAFFKSLMISFGLALVFGLTASIPLYLNESKLETYNKIGYTSILITSLFAVFANLDYMLRVLKGHIRKSGSSIAHIGFALIMIGVLISTSKKITISKNTTKQNLSELSKEFDNQKSMLLTQGDTVPMGPYMVTYTGREKVGIDYYFKVDYLTPDKNGKLEYQFTLKPKIQDNPIMGTAAEPGTKHFLDKDIYTVAYADVKTQIDSASLGKFKPPTNFVGHVKDTIFAGNAIIVIDSLRTNVNETEYKKSDSLLEVTVILKAYDSKEHVYTARPKYIIKNNTQIPGEYIIEELGLKFVFWKINPEEGTIEITMSERVGNSKDFIVMEAHLFPFINVLWLGCIIMALGTAIAILERIHQIRRRHA
ncbi:MAG: cytochrome c biogenesis protein CcsA [Bacteroidota bacterium]|nr:cytochrome c biogenesis protein CcsA [Bacteroidota bacterium]